MTCNCENIHKVTALAYTAGTSLILNVTNSTNIASLDEFNFFLPCDINPKTTVTGDPVQVYVTINGSNYQIFNKFHRPLLSNFLFRRKLYKAWFVTSGNISFVELQDLPKCKAHA